MYKVGDMGTFDYSSGSIPVVIVGIDVEDKYTEVRFVGSDGDEDSFIVGGEWEPFFAKDGKNIFET